MAPVSSDTRTALKANATTGRPDGTWNPEFNGTVMAMDPADDGQRVYAAGFFTTSRGTAARRAAALDTEGATLATPTWAPVWSHPTADYQQAIDQVGGDVWGRRRRALHLQLLDEHLRASQHECGPTAEATCRRCRPVRASSTPAATATPTGTTARLTGPSPAPGPTRNASAGSAPGTSPPADTVPSSTPS